MDTKTGSKKLWLAILRWAARVVALIFAIFIVAMFIGESAGGRQPGAPALVFRDYFLLSCLALYVVGLLLGLKWELWGGLISVAFCLVQIITVKAGGATAGIYMTLMIVPGLLFLLSWFLHRTEAKQ